MNTLSYSILTPTGDRESLELCLKYVDSQSIKCSQWVVVDDGVKESNLNYPQYTKYIRRNPSKSDPKHTLPLNLLTGLNHIETDYVFIFEDDDYYSAQYVEKLGFEHDLIGHDPTIYYHTKLKKYVVLPYKTNISLFCTGFSSKILNSIKQCISINNPFVDREIWKLGVNKKYKTFDTPLCVGLKGLEGRQGLTSGHKDGIYKKGFDDFEFKILKTWMKNDFELYNFI